MRIEFSWRRCNRRSKMRVNDREEGRFSMK
jgi:hypothetical protein